jgi:hypothetical protein
VRASPLTSACRTRRALSSPRCATPSPAAAARRAVCAAPPCVATHATPGPDACTSHAVTCLLSCAGAAGTGAGKGSSGAQGTKTCTGDPNKQPFDPTTMVRVRCPKGAACKRLHGPLMHKWRYTNEGVERTGGFVCSACGCAAHVA